MSSSLTFVILRCLSFIFNPLFSLNSILLYYRRRRYLAAASFCSIKRHLLLHLSRTKDRSIRSLMLHPFLNGFRTLAAASIFERVTLSSWFSLLTTEWSSRHASFLLRPLTHSCFTTLAAAFCFEPGTDRRRARLAAASYTNGRPIVARWLSLSTTDVFLYLIST